MDAAVSFMTDGVCCMADCSPVPLHLTSCRRIQHAHQFEMSLLLIYSDDQCEMNQRKRWRKSSLPSRTMKLLLKILSCRSYRLPCRPAKHSRGSDISFEQRPWRGPGVVECLSRETHGNVRRNKRLGGENGAATHFWREFGCVDGV